MGAPPVPRFDRTVAGLLLTLGVLTLGVGAYFLLIRPVMLPEDVRLTGVDPSLLPSAMVDWLRIVFRTLGGFVMGFGILMTSVAGYMLTARTAVLGWGAATAVVVAFSRFFVSNVSIRSDFLWFIGVLFAIAVLIALRVAFNASRGR
jgi:hypothetical protein